MTSQNKPTRASSAHIENPGGWRELFGGERRTAALVLAGGVALYAMNTFVTAALLPTTVADIGGERYFAWVTTSFMVASVLTSMLVARTLASHGAARAYVIAFLLFAAGSLGAAVSPTMEALLGARILQGLGGGLLAGLGYAVIREALPEHLWTRATGLVSAMWGLGTLVGPAMGGLFAQLQFWRGAFWVLTLASGVLGVMALRGLPHHSAESEEYGGIPATSLGMLVLAATAFSVAAIVPIGWPAIAAISLGIAFLVAFVVVERRASSPVLPHITYQRGNPLKWVYVTLGILSAAAMAEIFLPKFGQELAGMSPLLAGIFGATVSIGWSTVQLFSASVDDERIGRLLMRLGPVLVAVGLALFTASQFSDVSWIAWVWTAGLLLAGAGVGLAFPHLSVAAMRSSTDPVEASKAAAGVGTAELIANAISSTFVGILVAWGGAGLAGSATMGAGLSVLGVIGIVTVALAVRAQPRRHRLPLA